MPVLLNPYLHLHGTAREAMTSYQSLFGGELDVMTFAQMGEQGEHADLVMHAMLRGEHGVTLMAADVPPGMTVTPGDTVTLSLSGDDEPRLRGWFEALAEGGQVHVPLERQVWGDVFGQCADRFGVTWLVNIAAPA
ncbi:MULTISPECIES: VOC family protein [unclassified Nocardioides]|uniref:VOC family protein n=1 Tax=unclassified Nocardioides TaxID=2615069 RepID=UPI000703B74A|nr:MULTISPECIES: VOC family protein [unclassified Nocardioides]KQQ42076.1 3-demethylubiquinone-9 3-methyltransferase [Nocardioides sp. Leaf307]